LAAFVGSHPRRITADVDQARIVSPLPGVIRITDGVIPEDDGNRDWRDIGVAAAGDAPQAAPDLVALEATAKDARQGARRTPRGGCSDAGLGDTDQS
jgi:hypothetical protein